MAEDDVVVVWVWVGSSVAHAPSPKAAAASATIARIRMLVFHRLLCRLHTASMLRGFPCAWQGNGVVAWRIAPNALRCAMPTGQFQPDPGLVAALVAIAGIGNLVALTVLGLLTRMPVWLTVLIVVVELLAPLLVYQFLKRRQQR